MAARHPDAFKAKHDGLCALCSTFIVRDRSWVVVLPEAIVCGGVFAADGRPYFSGPSRAALVKPRKVAHERCARRHLKAQGGAA